MNENEKDRLDPDKPQIMKINYPANSKKSRDVPERKPIEKVISGEAVKVKKPLGRKIIETFTGDDMHSVGSYILFDVIIPAAKSMISEVASQGVERLLFGDSKRRSAGNRISYTNYNKPFSGAKPATNSRDLNYKSRATHDFEEVMITTRAEAQDVLDRLSDLIENYDVATVSDLYDLVGISGSFTDEKWGWSDIRGSHVVSRRGGYMLDLPRPTPID